MKQLDCNAPSRESFFQFIIKSNFGIALVLLHYNIQLAKDAANRQQKNVKLTLLQIELKSNVERLATYEPNLSCNKSDCCRMRNVVTESGE